MDVNFNTQGTGACPLCRNYESCGILKEAEKVFLNTVEEKYDDVMEVVIYRCPEFEEK
jgi:hypothetical protein